jgi:pyridoxal phosphate enzyme (YggS family)
MEQKEHPVELPVEELAARRAALARGLAEVRARVAEAAGRAGRDPHSVLLVAVTKTMPAPVIQMAYAAGLRVFGENRIQEAREKRGALALPEARWELIGHLQSNKAARAVELFERVQSVDSLAIAEALEARAAQANRVLPILLEVNVAGEASKSGFAPAEVVEAATGIAALPHLRPEGLMLVAPLVEENEAVRPVFRALRQLREELRERMPLGPDGGWPHLSMGMSDDYPVAVEEGATIIRLGRALFGDRPRP